MGLCAQTRIDPTTAHKKEVDRRLGPHVPSQVTPRGLRDVTGLAEVPR